MQERMQKLVSGTFAAPASFTAPALAKVVYNLPVLLAFDVLKSAVTAAKKERISVWLPNSKLWKEAEKHLPWENYQELMEGVEHRNQIAHDGELFECKICINDIKNVQKQLVAWDIIDSAQRIENLTVTVKRTRLQ